jgi:formiminoglutamase
MSARRVVNTIAGNWPAIRAGRFAELIRVDRPADCELALLGLPDDTGVRLNGGRPGAALGPSALRAALSTFGTPWDGKLKRRLEARIFDAGDVEPAPGDDEAALLATHERVEAAVLELHALGLTPICVGGGHDLTLPALRALARHSGGSLGGVNVDAHLDARERVGSGMAFRRLIDGNWLDARRFTEFGLGRFVNDAADAEWLTERGATLISLEAAGAETNLIALLQRASSTGNAAFLSVDLDAIDSAALPGVSALNPCGLSVARVAELVEAAAHHENVRHFDLMELSPPFDPSGRSARIAAHLLLCFVAGFVERRR